MRAPGRLPGIDPRFDTLRAQVELLEAGRREDRELIAALQDRVQRLEAGVTLPSQRNVALGATPQPNNASPSTRPMLSLDSERCFVINEYRCSYGKKRKPIQAPKGDAKPSKEATLLIVFALRSSGLPARIPRGREWRVDPPNISRVKQALPKGVDLIGEGDRQRLSPRVDLSEELLAIAKAHRLG